MPHALWDNLPRPILCLAPMDGYTDSAFRRICKSANPDIVVFTEFVSADGLHHQAKKLKEKLRFNRDEHPIIAQLFGKNGGFFKTAACYCESLGFDGIDINMGCPSKKVVKSEHGVALRKKPDLAYHLIESIATATKLPVSVKTRLGWSNADDLIAFGKGVENAGAQLITVHGRTYAQGFSDLADFEPIYQLKRSVSIPVIGNGDIQNYTDGIKKLGNLDGFMIGRASIGNPWVFAESQPTNFSNKIPLMLKHAELLWQSKGEKIAMLEIRKHLLAYVKGLPSASQYRSKLVHVQSLQEIRDILETVA